MYQLFSDLQTMVHSQGLLIDSVEQNVKDAKNYIDNSAPMLENAKRIHKRKQWVSERGSQHSESMHCCLRYHCDFICGPLRYFWSRKLKLKKFA